jgi:hypothetical protein
LSCGWSAIPAQVFEPRPDVLAIGEPQLRAASDGTLVSSDPEIRHPRHELRETLRFRLPGSCEPFVAPHIDPVVVGLPPDRLCAAQHRIRR